MNTPLKAAAAALTIASATLLAGCVISGSHKEHVSGRPISTTTLDRLTTGRTTHDQAVDLLGPPTRTMNDSEKTVLVYEYARSERGKGRLIFVFSSTNESIEKRTAYLEFQDNILTNKWIDEG